MAMQQFFSSRGSLPILLHQENPGFWQKQPESFLFGFYLCSINFLLLNLLVLFYLKRKNQPARLIF
ncbi:hypothetical protein CYJ37_06945 [Bacillus sp. UMB0728]|nr:hypothetical protein CYJ37_06945 [Bacillus sp. UMB0728]